NGPDSICQGAAASFTDSSSNGTTYHWDFGDGGTSGTSPTTHIFDTTGIYTIIYIVSNPTSCNGADTIIKHIKVLGLPIADFTYSPLTPETNVPTTFTNLSVNADRYLWDFGDGATTPDVNPSHFYKRTGDYKVCLTAKNSSNCPSTACKMVSADVRPLADLPTAFSPNGDGKNDILFVRGAAIQTMDVKIFNRWGEKVFETTDMNKGWDGTFNGQAQPMDAYAFILNVTFIDGTTFEKKGNVTLLR
ncbi:MAG: gliding motility-associated C-terminal domain-containing protein, partial [Bacteroidetes bacterium]|nr:gliding motility-associated C-terminal domain-containing protein [Bacteroidota bacterium]